MGAASSITSRPASATTTSRQELNVIDFPVDMAVFDRSRSDSPGSEDAVRTIPLVSHRALPPVPTITPVPEREERGSSLLVSPPSTAQAARTASSPAANSVIQRTSSPARPVSNESKLRITELQQGSVKRVLTELEEHFLLSFDHERVLREARPLELPPNAEVLKQGAQALGLCVVDAGVLHVSDGEGSVVLAHLLKWDMCGELSTLFDIPCSASVSVSPDQG